MDPRSLTCSILLLSLTIFAWTPDVHAQDLTVDPAQSKIVLQGTSSLHDWESVLEKYDLRVAVNGTDVQAVNFKAAVTSLKSGKSKMDELTYEALKADKHPMITFTSGPFVVKDGRMSGKGKLTIAGVTKEVVVNATIESWTKGHFLINGEVTLLMTTFGVEPPTAMFGTIKTGDEVKLVFELSLTQ